MAHSSGQKEKIKNQTKHRPLEKVPAQLARGLPGLPKERPGGAQPRRNGPAVRREPISKSCEITQADNLNRRRRLSRKAQ